MAEVASAYVALLPSARGFGTSAKRQINPQMLPVGRSVGAGLGRSMLKGFIAIGVITKITQFVGDAFAEAREAQKVGALTDQVIKSTGGVAKVTAVQVDRLADALSRKTGIDDEQIATASNLLLTFKNVRREGAGLENIFNRATRASADLSAAGFGSMEATAKQLGKALNDPLKGLTALGRAGVTFTDQQKEQIETLVASGKTLEAQKVILAEVESQVGGAAEATATLGDKSKVAFDNIKESIGTALLPAVENLQKAFVEKIAPAIQGFITNLQTGEGTAGRFGTFMRETVVPALREFYTYIFTKVIPAIRDGLGPAFEEGKKAFNKIRDAIKRNEPELRELFNAFKKVADFVLTKLIPAQLKIAAVAIPILSAAIRFLIGGIAFWVNAFNAARNTVNRVKDAVTTAAGEFKFAAQKIVLAFKGMPAQMRAIGVSIVLGLVRGIQKAAGLIDAAVNAIVDKIPKAIREKMGIGSPSRVTFELGLNIAQGLANGLVSGGKKVSDATEKMADGIKSQLSTLKSDFASLSESIAGAFTGNLFEAETAAGFIANLTSTKGTLTALKAAFKTLIGWGLSPKFLSQLFASGNAALILDLAASGQGAAVEAATLFGDVQSLSTSLGKDVAGADLGPRLDKISNKLDRLIAATKNVGADVGHEVNGAARNGKRKARAA